ncbi:MAG: diguanylate cyclase [Burkholderiales bacterium]|nr:diguanylate cyclase [Burkholderiales bacterium]
MSLKFRLIIALMIGSLAAAAVVGGVAYWRFTAKFSTLRQERAARDFREGVAEYIQTYGSMEAGRQQQPFPDFMEARHRRHIGQQPESSPGPDAEQGPPPDDRRAGPPDDRPPGPRDGFGPPGERRPVPFRFTLIAPDGRVMMGPGPYHPGDVVGKAVLAASLPVEVNGRVAAYVSTEGAVVLGPTDKQYLDAVQSALIVGVSAAVLLSVALGLLFAQGLSTPLGKLTEAVRAMQGGQLRQHVPEQGSSEIRDLAAAFNHMSDELAASHEALELSRRLVQNQANELRELSIRDPLTGLYNRRHFDEQARQLYDQSQRHAHPLTVAIADIDFFKRINDQFSHATGDAVLKQLAEIVHTHMRRSDLVARYGGEEFVFALPETPLPQAAALCDKLRGLIEAFPWQKIHPELKVTLSIGLCADAALGGAEAMLQRADTLLYTAKEAGRNRVCFA